MFMIFIFLFNFWSVFRGLPEGSPCIASEGHFGTCRHWKRCLTLAIDHQNYEYPTVPLEHDDEVEAEERDADNQPSTPAVLHRIAQNRREELVQNYFKCIDYYVSLPYYDIKQHCHGSTTKSWNEERGCFGLGVKGVCGIGGRDANRSEYPHMALLGFGPSQDTTEYLCAGTLLSEQFILTAAHCSSSAGLGPVKFAALGVLRRSDRPQLWQHYYIERVLPHPSYRSPHKYHDIALLRTSTIITFNHNVVPACLPNLSARPAESSAVDTGWGAMGRDADLADALQAVPLTQFSQSTCASQYRRHRHLRRGYDHSTQMCYGDQLVVRDTCKGDSGGPLQVSGPFGTPPTVIGITSYGAACGVLGQAGVYTRLEPYIPWIDSIVWA